MAVAPEFGQEKGERLGSWKAIARYLGRDIRSAQRWERERGLPVHRVPGEKGGAVFAYAVELDRWLVSRSRDRSEARDGELRQSAAPVIDVAPESDVAPEPATTARPARSLAPDTGSFFGRNRRWMSWAAGAMLVLLVAISIALLKPFAIAPRGSPPILAVLPLRNLSGDPSKDYFADGFSEELVTELSELHALRVVSSASSMLYKERHEPLAQIAQELHAKLLLEGTVAQQTERVRVTAQLIDAASGSVISAGTYSGDLKDVFEIQQRIAQAIAGDVRLDLSRAERDRLTSPVELDPQVLDLYLKGRFELAKQTPDSIRTSLARFEESAALAPQFARAHVGIAEAQAALLQITAQGPEETEHRERQALTKALAIDPDLAEATGLLASLDYWMDWDWPRADREFRRALSRGAGVSVEQRFGSALITRGRYEEGMAHLLSAVELDPLNLSPRVNYFFGLYFQRKYALAGQEMQDTLARNPRFVAGHALVGLAAMMRTDCSQVDDQAKWLEANYPSAMAHFISALASSCRGDRRAARDALDQAGANDKMFVSPYQLALGYASIDEPARALDLLEKSAAAREPQILYLNVEPQFDSLRSEPRFIALRKRVGLN
jgi:adenylate cyclase